MNGLASSTHSVTRLATVISHRRVEYKYLYFLLTQYDMHCPVTDYVCKDVKFCFSWIYTCRYTTYDNNVQRWPLPLSVIKCSQCSIFLLYVSFSKKYKMFKDVKWAHHVLIFQSRYLFIQWKVIRRDGTNVCFECCVNSRSICWWSTHPLCKL